MDAEDWMCTME
jgi:hypothetical protein